MNRRPADPHGIFQIVRQNLPTHPPCFFRLLTQISISAAADPKAVRWRRVSRGFPWPRCQADPATNQVRTPRRKGDDAASAQFDTGDDCASSSSSSRRLGESVPVAWLGAVRGHHAHGAARARGEGHQRCESHCVVGDGCGGAATGGEGKKWSASRSWILLDTAGEERVLDADKYAIMHRVDINARDLHILDPSTGGFL